MTQVKTKSESGQRRWLVLVLLVVLVCIGGYLIADWYQSEPSEVTKTFVGRDSCIVCHQEQADLFHGSHHDLAMDLATAETVLADFDGQEIKHFGITSRVFKDGDRFVVNTEGADGEMKDFEVKYVFGVTPLQQYMVEFDESPVTKVADGTSKPIGRLQVLRLSWDTLNKKWFYLSPPDVKEKLDPSDPLHWTGVTQCWNSNCAECHSTNLKKNFDPLSRSYATTFSEIDVSCEACHGPGSLHVKIANKKSLFWDREHGYGLLNLKTKSNLPQIETCAPCHSRRVPIGGDFVGCRFDDHYSCQLIMDQVYHADGQIRDEDYVYGSFIQSKMFHNGIKCTDCHDPHSTRVKFDGNELCTSCHQHPAGKYDTPNHHHHKVGSTGALCVECHMPSTTYMDVDARRDHSLRAPRPDLSVKFGTPNACTACHVDTEVFVSKPQRPLKQYLDWIIARDDGDDAVTRELSRVDQAMSDAFKEWYPVEQSAPRSKYYEQLALGLSDSTERHATLSDLATDRSAPAIFRASAAQELADDDSQETFDAIKKVLRDPDVKVITAGLSRLELEISRISDRMRYSESPKLREFKEIVELLAGLFDHSSRRVRMQAARVFASVPAAAQERYSNTGQRKNFQIGLKEYRKSLNVGNDRAITHTMLAGVFEMQGDVERAKDAYRTAIMVEPSLAGPRSNLAAILDGQSRELQSQMRPDSGQGIEASQLQSLSERLGRLQSESIRLRKEDHELLRIDMKRSEGLPGTDALHYRFAMSSYIQGDMEATEKHLLRANEMALATPTYLLGLATYYQQVGNPAAAARFVEQLVKIDPKHPGYRALAEEVSKQLKQLGD